MTRFRNGSRAPGLLLLLLLLVLATGGVLPPPVLAAPGSAPMRQARTFGIDPADMDLAVDPGVDFYRFANGGWLDRTTIPPDEGAYSVGDEIRDRDRRDLLALLDRLAADATLAEGTDEWKADRLFRQGTDLTTRNAQGIEPVRPVLAKIDAIEDLAGFHRFLRGSAFAGVPGLFPIWGRHDPTNASVVVAHLVGPWLGLPNRDYYLDEDAATERARLAYLRASAELLTFTGIDREAAREATLDVYDLERRLAEQTLPREQSGDLARRNNPRTIDDLARTYPLMDWPGYLAALGIADQRGLIVLEVQYLTALPDIVAETPLDVLKDYLRVQLLWNVSNALSEEFAEVAFSFHGAALGGLEAMPPIEERVIGAVGWSMGDALGKLYVAERFSPEARTQATALVEEVRDAFRLRLETNPWLSAETKTTALDKLERMGSRSATPIGGAVTRRWRSRARTSTASAAPTMRCFGTTWTRSASRSIAASGGCRLRRSTPSTSAIGTKSSSRPGSCNPRSSTRGPTPPPTSAASAS